MMSPRAVAPLSLVTTLLLAGCGAASGSEDGSDASDAKLDVRASFYPLEWVTERVGGDRVAVSSLTPPGVEAHDLELTPRDVAGLAEADAVVYLAGFQPAVDDGLESLGDVETIDAAELTSLNLISARHPVGEDDHAGDAHGDDAHADDAHADDAHADDAHGDEQHADDAHADEHGHDAGPDATDPHFWLDPMRLAEVADGLSERMAELDPEGAETYTANAEAVRDDLEALDQEMSRGLADCESRTLVTSHDAFHYLTDRYGFETVGVSGLSPEDEPSPGELAEAAEFVRENGIRTIYFETLTDPAQARTVADETGARTATLDPLEGLTEDSAGSDYLEVMRANLETIRSGQACS